MRQLNKAELKVLLDDILAKMDDRLYEVETDTTAVPVYEGTYGTADIGRPPRNWDLGVQSIVYLKVRKIR